MPIITAPHTAAGGFSPSRNVGQTSLGFSQQVLRNTVVQVALSVSGGDATMIDLAVPTYPKTITPGLYAFTLSASQSVEGDQPFSIGLVVDDNYHSINAFTYVFVPAGLTSCTSAVTWWCDASDPFFVRVSVDASGAVDPTFAGNVYVQRIS